ncbi:uncharacterized protein LACBIDRAFT_322415 [Laccaria bicolor S238N-H82]|uniref:Predicted protein n=1 Tax=Laccaria bicolor (strain S238N-H82 / ATCC MYA-4686) TaxID=486041 RepID=B0CW76_LACBS|nr:uncharacterized protein LACBIDRAFT_322415 [Laccaria bicolor S238N-H82]EDR13022.1 predicted protein [Laccaria bicolor S238N-H82]|eukprot:XP_001875520.1 predicted protein [Laccaria bicolor S238N-H82]
MTFLIGKYANIVINKDNTLLAINSSGPKSVGKGSPPKCALCLTSVTIQGPGIRNIFGVHSSGEIYFGCDIGQQNIFSIHGVCKTNSSFRLTRDWTCEHYIQAPSTASILIFVELTIASVTPGFKVFASSVQSGFLPPKRATVDRNWSRTDPDIQGTELNHLGPVFSRSMELVQTDPDRFFCV